MPLLVIGRDRSDFMTQNYTADSLIGPRVSKAIGWNMYDPDSAAYLACFLDAAISAERQLMMQMPKCVIVTVMSHVREGQTSLPMNQYQTVRAFAVTTRGTRRFLRD